VFVDGGCRRQRGSGHVGVGRWCEVLRRKLGKIGEREWQGPRAGVGFLVVARFHRRWKTIRGHLRGRERGQGPGPGGEVGGGVVRVAPGSETAGAGMSVGVGVEGSLAGGAIEAAALLAAMEAGEFGDEAGRIVELPGAGACDASVTAAGSLSGMAATGWGTAI